MQSYIDFAHANIEAYVAALSANQDRLTAATRAQNAAALAARKAITDDAASLQNFAIDAGKSVTRLTNLRQETVKYYEAQKAFAALMGTSASNLRTSVGNYRYSQLSPDAQAASLKARFANAYTIAQATQGDGSTLASYTDKLNNTLGPLIDKLNETGQSGLVASYLSQAEAIAKLLEDNAPKNYQEDSLAMLGTIDTALAALAASTQSAEKIIAGAIGAGADRTVAGLHAIIAAVTGQTVPAFAAGGSYGGGVALVGEDGPELLNFNQPGQVFTADQTAGMFGSRQGGAVVVAELQALRSEVSGLRAETRAIVSSSSKTSKILERVTPDGSSLQTTAAI